MKKSILSVFLISVSLISFGQSKSYEALQSHFKGKKDVHSFRLGGILCRAALSIATSNQPLFREMVKDIDQVRFIVIPIEEFEKQNLSVNGFKSYLSKDSFETLATIREDGDRVSIFHRTDSNLKDRYFVLIEERREVVAIEMKGYIDPSVLKPENTRITLEQ